MPTTDKQIAVELFKGFRLKSFKTVFIGEEKLPFEVENSTNYLSIENASLFGQLVGCIPRFYHVDKLPREEL